MCCSSHTLAPASCDELSGNVPALPPAWAMPWMSASSAPASPASRLAKPSPMSDKSVPVWPMLMSAQLSVEPRSASTPGSERSAVRSASAALDESSSGAKPPSDVSSAAAEAAPLPLAAAAAALARPRAGATSESSTTTHSAAALRREALQCAAMRAPALFSARGCAAGALQRPHARRGRGPCLEVAWRRTRAPRRLQLARAPWRGCGAAEPANRPRRGRRSRVCRTCPFCRELPRRCAQMALNS